MNTSARANIHEAIDLAGISNLGRALGKSPRSCVRGQRSPSRGLVVDRCPRLLLTRGRPAKSCSPRKKASDEGGRFFQNSQRDLQGGGEVGAFRCNQGGIADERPPPPIAGSATRVSQCPARPGGFAFSRISTRTTRLPTISIRPVPLPTLGGSPAAGRRTITLMFAPRLEGRPGRQARNVTTARAGYLPSLSSRLLVWALMPRSSPVNGPNGVSNLGFCRCGHSEHPHLELGRPRTAASSKLSCGAHRPRRELSSGAAQASLPRFNLCMPKRTRR